MKKPQAGSLTQACAGVSGRPPDFRVRFYLTLGAEAICEPWRT